MKKIRIFCLLLAFAVVIPIAAKKTESESYNMKRGLEELNKGNLEEAVEFFNKEIIDNPKNGEAHFSLALISFEKEDFKTGLSKLDRTLKCLPSKEKMKRASAYTLRGEVYLNLGDTIRALSDFDTAVKTDSSYDEVYFSRADLYHKMGRLDDSDADLRKAISINPADSRSYIGMGVNQFQRGNYDKAIELLDKALSMEKENSFIYTFRAKAKYAQKNYVDAAEDLIEAIAIDYDRDAVEYLEDFPKEQLPMVVAKLKSKSLKDPYESIWPYAIAKVYMNHRMYDRAIEALNDVLKLDNHNLIYMGLADCNEALGNFDKALANLRKAIELDKNQEGYKLARIALITEYMGDLDEALSMWDDIIGIEPDNFYSYYRKGFIKENQGRYDESLADHEMALLLNPEAVHSLLGKADILTIKGEPEKAKEFYTRIIELDNEASTESVAMYAYYGLGDFDRAKEFMQKIIQLDPEEPGSYYDATCLYSRMGEVEKSLEYLKTALDKGFNKYRLILTDNDLDELRKTAGFQVLYDQHKEQFENVQNYKAPKNVSISERDEEIPVISSEKIEIPYTPDFGCAVVKCTINDLPLSFVFDTGASIVSISQLEANFMLKNGYLSKEDFIGTGRFVDANGDVTEGTVINLRNVEFGGLNLPNVKASVIRNQKAPLLLGQSVLGRLGSIEIDNSNQKIIITQ